MWIASKGKLGDTAGFMNFVDKDPKQIKWSNALFIKGSRGTKIHDTHDYRVAMYRPFVKKYVAFNAPLFYDFVKWGNLQPHADNKNLFIAVPGIGNTKDFCAIMTREISDLCVASNHCQVFPLKWFENSSTQMTFMDVMDGTKEGQYSISSEIKKQFQEKYSDESIKEEDIFFYIYGLFHSKTYISKYSSDLAKVMPRIPFLKDFWGYSKIGRELADLHLNYETAEPYQGVDVEMRNENYRVTKIRYLAKDQKDTILFNDSITIKKIPLKAYDYVVNGRSPIDWVLDQYQYTVDKDSGIIDDPNLYDEKKGGKYVFDLILSLITVSLKTMDLMDRLPEYEEI